MITPAGRLTVSALSFAATLALGACAGGPAPTTWSPGARIRFENEAEDTMSRRVRRPHVDHHLFADVVTGLLRFFVAHRCIRRNHASHGIRVFDFARGKGHGVGLGLCSRVGADAQG